MSSWHHFEIITLNRVKELYKAKQKQKLNARLMIESSNEHNPSKLLEVPLKTHHQPHWLHSDQSFCPVNFPVEKKTKET